jgi:hypothetical protein
MTRKKLPLLLRYLLLVSSVCGLLACHKPAAKSDSAKPNAQPASVGTPVAPSAERSRSPLPAIADQLVPKTSPTQSPSPTAVEINDAVARVFEQAAVPGTTPKTNFVVGDFNGDGSEDLAVVVKPNETKLAEVNSEMANWILEDPKKIVLPSSSLAVPISNKPAPVRAESGDKLLAVIHGVGSQGWRSADAKQTFLLKNAAAADMTIQTRKSLRESKDRQKLPPIRGDAIQEAIGGKSGLILWTGAKYAWYSPDLK